MPFLYMYSRFARENHDGGKENQALEIERQDAGESVQRLRGNMSEREATFRKGNQHVDKCMGHKYS